MISRLPASRKLIAFALLLAFAVIGAVLLSAPSHTQVVGTLAPDDLKEILRLVRKDLRNHLLPPLQWDTLRHPRYAITSMKEYQAQHILWAEVHDDGSVDVYAGASKDVIRDEGHVWTFRKDSNWSSTGYAYWASSDVAPAGIHVPPPQ